MVFQTRHDTIEDAVRNALRESRTLKELSEYLKNGLGVQIPVSELRMLSDSNIVARVVYEWERTIK